MPIPDSFIDELVARNDIVDTVSSYVALTKKGSNYWGLCPFHNEKTPSFSVSASKQIYHCFGCGKGGGVISFVMEQENLAFPDAVRLLAQRAGLEMPEELQNAGDGKRRERLLQLNREAARYFHANLSQPEARAGVDYLNHRGLSRRTVTNFGLGYAPDSWDGLISAMSARGYTKGDLLEGGLAVKNSSGRIYDRFRGRVMFPIIDIRGNVIGFGGRVLDDSTPKYLNSPDTPVYNKSRNLFALNIAKKSKRGQMILTEGYMDTISLHQAGFDCAVASLGTSLTQEHAQLLSRYAKEVIIAYDGDGAGVNAAQRAIRIFEKTGLQVKILQVQGAKDPDEFIKKYGPEAFERLLTQSENHIEYRLLQVQKKYNLEEDSQKVAYLKEAAGLVAGLTSPVEREVYGRKAAQAARFDAAAMMQEVERTRKSQTWKARKQEERRELTPAVQSQPKNRAFKYENVSSALAEEGVLRLVLLDPTLARKAEALKQEDFSSPLLGKIFGLLLQRWREGKELQAAALAGALEPEEMSHLASILQKPESLANGEQALSDYIRKIQMEQVKRANANGLDPLLAYREKKAMEDRK
ncbi:MAG: DNA primase [Oscillospiraceae bacterium]|nr:DNA primase [Oscillospiraceae bacterium]